MSLNSLLENVQSVPAPLASVPEGYMNVLPGLAVRVELVRFFESVLDSRYPGTKSKFWSVFESLAKKFGPRNAELLTIRDELTEKIDEWCKEKSFASEGKYPPSGQEMCNFMKKVGYLEEPVGRFTVETKGLDVEVTTPGPQLVVPSDNKRFLVNAVNARFLSLNAVDKAFTKDGKGLALPVLKWIEDGADGVSLGGFGAPASTGRKQKATLTQSPLMFQVLDSFLPLAEDGFFWNRVERVSIRTPAKAPSAVSSHSASIGSHSASIPNEFDFSALIYGTHVSLLPRAGHLIAWKSDGEMSKLVFEKNGLRFVLCLSRWAVTVDGKSQAEGNDSDARNKGSSSAPNNASIILDLMVESALTSILDLEDSVAVVDAEDKVRCYSNILSCFDGSLSAGKDKSVGSAAEAYAGVNGSTYQLPLRSRLLVRHVGIQIYSPMVLVRSNAESGRMEDGRSWNMVPETFVDLMFSCLVAKTRMLKVHSSSSQPPSSSFSHYVVQPKLHGSDEVRHIMQMMDYLEVQLDLPNRCLKFGLMDEERRTSANLLQCIKAAGSDHGRLFFVNTGFLDRTGDEIRTLFYLGPFVGKEAMKSSRWLRAYETRSVLAGFVSGMLSHTGGCQVGKGMWAIPDDMQGLLNTKHAHIVAGATTAWVPSPAAATLHALQFMAFSQKGVRTRMRLSPSFPDSLTHARVAYENLIVDLMTPAVLPLAPLFSSDASAQSSQSGLQGQSGPLGSAQPHLAPSIDKFGLFSDEVLAELRSNAQGVLGYVTKWVNDGIGCSKIPNLKGVGLMEDLATVRISTQAIANWKHHGLLTDEQARTVFVDALKASGISGQAAILMSISADKLNNGYTTHVLTPARIMVKSQRSGSKL